MEDWGNNQEQMMHELRSLRQRVAELEALEGQYKRDRGTIHTLLRKIERAKQEWETTVDSLQDLACLVDNQGRIIRANRIVEAWHLGKVVDVEGRDFHGLLHPGCTTPSCYLNALWAHTGRRAIRGGTHQWERYDEVLNRYVLVSVRPCNTNGKKGLASGSTVVIVRDISERKRAEEVTVRAERLTAMRQIVVTVCHEINNPLTAVLGYAQWLQTREGPLPSGIRDALERIEIGAKSIGNVVRKLYDIEDRPVPYAGGTTMIDINGSPAAESEGAEE